MDALQEASFKRPIYAQCKEKLSRLINADYTDNLPARAQAKSIWRETVAEAEALEDDSPLPILVSCITTEEVIPGLAGISWVTTDYIYFLPELSTTIVRSFMRERTEKDLLPHTVDLTKASSFKKSTERQTITSLEIFTQRQLANHLIETWQEFETQLKKKFSLS